MFTHSLLALLATGLMFCRPASAGIRFFATGDYYLHDGIEDDIDQDNQDAVNVAPNSSGEVTTTNGIGGRLGLRVPIADNRFDVGASFSYIKGPEIDSKFTSPVGDLNSNSDTMFTRIMAEAGFRIPINEHVGIRLAGAAGFARSTVETDTDGTGLLLVHKSSDESKDGFTWEASPALVVTASKVDIELGVRYAQFPKIDRSDGTPHIEWKPFGFYLGVAF